MSSSSLLFIFLETLEDLYAFSYNPQSEQLTRSAGWALFDIQSEYARMGLPNSEWCCSNLNKDYRVSIFFLLTFCYDESYIVSNVSSYLRIGTVDVACLL